MDHSIKTSAKIMIKKLIGRFGYQISRLPYRPGNPDEIIKYKIGKYTILLNGDHMLPQYMKYNRFYSSNLPRLAKSIKAKYNDLKMIDIGANVGDTVALVKNAVDIPIICLEGQDDFFEILKMNLGNFKDVTAYKYFLGEEREIIKTSLEKKGDTARLNDSSSSVDKKSVELITLDYFFKSNKSFKSAKLLKIDTDGYDLKIIKGGMNYIKETKPVLFFEYDPVMFAEMNDNALEIFKILESNGYKDIVFYDHLGNFILSTELSNHLLIEQLDKLVDRIYRTPFPFYDVALFHKDDADIAERFIKDEMIFYHKE